MTTYKDAGVDVHLKETLLRRIRDHVASPHRPEVIGGIGAFGGMFRFSGMRDGVLVASADGVGTKVKIAELLDSHETVGADLVNHCINDVAVMGAEPLFFLDYFSAGKLDPGRVERVAGGVAGPRRGGGTRARRAAGPRPPPGCWAEGHGWQGDEGTRVQGDRATGRQGDNATRYAPCAR